MGVISILGKKLQKEIHEKEVYQANIQYLLGSVNRYKTKDSLDAVSVREIELNLWEYECIEPKT